MNCRKWQILMMRKNDGETNEMENRNLFLHLKSCPQCQKLEQDLEQILTGLEKQQPLDLKIDPKLELKVMNAVHCLKYRTPTETGIIRLIYAGLGLVFTGILVNIGSGLVNSGFFNLFLKISDGLSQIARAATTMEVLYHILQPFISQELNTVTQWVLSIYKGALLVSIILLIRFIYTQKRYVPEGNCN